MGKDKKTTTPAIRALKEAGLSFTLHTYPYKDKGGTGRAAKFMEAPEHQVIKTLVMKTDGDDFLVILMHGDMQVSTKMLARRIEAKSVVPVSPREANRATGYQVGGISPLGIRHKLPIYAEETIAGLGEIYINAGKRGLLARLAPAPLLGLLKARPVTVGIPG